jgi:hypothetical protein
MFGSINPVKDEQKMLSATFTGDLVAMPEKTSYMLSFHPVVFQLTGA